MASVIKILKGSMAIHVDDDADFMMIMIVIIMIKMIKNDKKNDKNI
jgi:hypothetical protein